MYINLVRRATKKDILVTQVSSVLEEATEPNNKGADFIGEFVCLIARCHVISDTQFRA